VVERFYDSLGQLLHHEEPKAVVIAEQPVEIVAHGGRRLRQPDLAGTAVGASFPEDEAGKGILGHARSPRFRLRSSFRFSVYGARISVFD